MDHRTREQQRRETEVREVESHADIASERESVHRIVASLGKLEGTAMKLGQHMSYFEPTWSEDVRGAGRAADPFAADARVARHEDPGERAA